MNAILRLVAAEGLYHLINWALGRLGEGEKIPQSIIGAEQAFRNLAGVWPRETTAADLLRQLRAQAAGTRRIVCAAVKWHVDGRVVCGVHHGTCVAGGMLAGLPGESKHFEAGFMDTGGKFLTRAEAWKVADAAGQILRPTGHEPDYSRARPPNVGDEGTLFSENLYKW